MINHFNKFPRNGFHKCDFSFFSTLFLSVFIFCICFITLYIYFLSDYHYIYCKCSFVKFFVQCSLLICFRVLLVTFCSLLVTFWPSLFTICSLLVTFYCSSLYFPCSSLLSGHYISSFLEVLVRVFTSLAYFTKNYNRWSHFRNFIFWFVS